MKKSIIAVICMIFTAMSMSCSKDETSGGSNGLTSDEARLVGKWIVESSTASFWFDPNYVITFKVAEDGPFPHPIYSNEDLIGNWEISGNTFKLNRMEFDVIELSESIFEIQDKEYVDWRIRMRRQ